MRSLLTAMFCCLPLFATAQDASLLGAWEGDDRAAQSIYGTLKIANAGLSWGGHLRHVPACRASFTLVPEQKGVEFKDQTGRSYVTSADSPFKTYLLKLKGGKCTNGVVHLRLTITNDEPGSLAMVEYRDNGEAVGWMHFARR
jgi:hypothetical protein